MLWLAFFGSLLIEVRHEDLEASLCGHASVAVDELVDRWREGRVARDAGGGEGGGAFGS